MTEEERKQQPVDMTPTKKKRGPKPGCITRDPDGVRVYSNGSTRRRLTKSHENISTPEIVERAGELFLRGEGLVAISKKLDVTQVTAKKWIQQCQKIWREKVADTVGVELAKVESLERFAWEQLQKSTQPIKSKQIEEAAEEAGLPIAVVKVVTRRTTGIGNTGWAGVIQWCIDYRTRIIGGYAPDRLKIETEFRVAGKSKDEILQFVADRINKAASATN